jgi:hypothetical protein
MRVHAPPHLIPTIVMATVVVVLGCSGKKSPAPREAREQAAPEERAAVAPASQKNEPPAEAEAPTPPAPPSAPPSASHGMDSDIAEEDDPEQPAEESALDDWEATMLGATVDPQSAPVAQEEPVARENTPRTVPRLIVYDFDSAFDDGALGATVADVITGHAFRSEAFETFAELVQEERLRTKPLRASFGADVDPVVQHAREVFGADMAIWGTVTGSREEPTLHVLAMDLRGTKEAVLLRDTYPCPNIHYMPMAAERILAACLGLGLTERAPGRALETLSKNLVPNGDFESGLKGWENPMPGSVEVVDGVLTYRMDEAVAGSSGIGVLSEYIPVEPNTHYVCSIRVRSKPSIIVWVKGYAQFAANTPGEETVDPRREVYRHQMRPQKKVAPDAEGWYSASTDPFRPRHFRHDVTWMRVKLYAYYPAGTVEFDDIVLRAVSVDGVADEDERMLKAFNEKRAVPTDDEEGQQ